MEGRKRARDEGDEAAQPAEQSSAQLAAALAERDEARAERDAAARAAPPPPPPFRGPAADSVLGELLIDVIGIVAAVGFAAEVAHCLYLCGVTYRKGDKGATNDMIARSMEKQGWAARLREARAVQRDKHGRTQLFRAVLQKDLPRVLQLVQLGAPLERRDDYGNSALFWAIDRGHAPIAAALLDGRGANVDARDRGGNTPLMLACDGRHKVGIVRLLLAHGARPELQSSSGWTALHNAVLCDKPGLVALLCAAPGAAAALTVTSFGRTPLGFAAARGRAVCEAVLRAHGAPEY